MNAEYIAFMAVALACCAVNYYLGKARGEEWRDRRTWLTVKFKRLGANGIIPARARAGDSGLDVRAAECVIIQPRKHLVVRTHIGADIPHGYEIQVRPRSGLSARFGVLAAFGTVDSGYRGEIGVDLYNFGDEPYTVYVGDRIAQLVVAKAECVDVQLTEELSPSERGQSGFGSTGIR